MPDTRHPHDPMSNDNLDDRIRQLVARVVSDSPSPPDVTRHEGVIEPIQPDHRRWWLGGGAALAAAATIIAVFTLAVTGDDTAEPTAPATQPPGVATTLPATETTPPSTAGTPDVSVAEPGAVLTAGPEGVVEHLNGNRRVLTDEPMAIALDTGDGRVIVQRESGWTGDDGNWERTVPRMLAANGTLSDLFGTFEWGGAVTLHDVENVGGRTLLLYGLQDQPAAAGPTLYVVDLDSERRTEVTDQLGTIVLRSDRLQLATNGLIVGTWSTSIATGISIYAVPDSLAASQPVEPGDLGLGEPYEDCLECPRSFSVTPDGQTFAWLEGENTLRIRTLSGSYDEPFVLDDALPNTIGAGLEIGGDHAVLTPHRLNSDSPPVALDLADPSAEPKVLDGVVATLGPATTQPAPALPGSSGTTTTTAVPAPRDIDDVVTAGPDGVVVYEEGEARTITPEPMEMAIATGDGRFIVQRRVGYGEPERFTAADTMPLVLSADGTMTELPPGAEPSWITLHDIEIVDDRRLLLYTSDPDVPNDDPAVDGQETSAFALDLEVPEAEPLDLGPVAGYEWSVTRLHLSTDGLIVGEETQNVYGDIVIMAVPESPADDGDVPTAEDLGLQLDNETHADCNDCPHNFTIGPHGRHVVWIDRTPGINGHHELVVQRIGGEPAQPVDVFPEGVNTTQIADLDYLAEGDILLSYDRIPGEDVRPPVYISGGRPKTLPGIVATANPVAKAASDPGTSPGEACGVDPQAPQITDSIGDVPAPQQLDSAVWVYDGESNFDPCAALSYALVDVAGGTGSSPRQLMLFHDGEYIGTATECAFGFMSVIATTADSVTVEYRWPRAGDATASPSGTATVTYRWNGEAGETDGELPGELLQLSGCSE